MKITKKTIREFFSSPPPKLEKFIVRLYVSVMFSSIPMMFGGLFIIGMTTAVGASNDELDYLQGRIILAWIVLFVLFFFGSVIVEAIWNKIPEK